MATLQEKLNRVEDAKGLIESLVAAGVNLKSKEAVAVGLEYLHAIDAVAQEFGYEILKPIK